MYSQAISESLLKLLQRLDTLGLDPSWYLGGGTALALQLGHRTSEDLDFFSPTFHPASIPAAIEEANLKTTLVNQSADHLETLIEAIKVDFIREQTPPLFPLKTLSPLATFLKIADSRDIGRMKLVAIGSRGSKKDFFDLYCLTREAISLDSLIGLALGEKQPVRFSTVLFLKGLVDFDEAEKDPDPRMIRQITWKEVKKTLKEEVKRIVEKL